MNKGGSPEFQAIANPLKVRGKANRSEKGINGQ